MSDTPKYVLVAADGTETPTSSERLRYRLLAQGHTEKPTEPRKNPPGRQEPQGKPADTKPDN